MNKENDNGGPSELPPPTSEIEVSSIIIYLKNTLWGFEYTIRKDVPIYIYTHNGNMI